jgi:hypothetical protein
MLRPLSPLPTLVWPANNGDPPAAPAPTNVDVVAELWEEDVEGNDGEGEAVPDVEPDPLLDVDPEFCGLR